MVEVIAVDGGGELSRGGSLTNTLFTNNQTGARVGDVGTVTVKLSESGYESPNFYLGCTAGLALSVDGVTYGAEAAPLSLGTVNNSGTIVYVKCVSVHSGLVSIILPQGDIRAFIDPSVTVSPSPKVITSIVLDPTVTGQQMASITSDSLGVTVTVLDPIVSLIVAVNITANADLMSLTASTLVPVASGASNFTTSLLAATSTLLAPSVSTGGATVYNFYINATGLQTTAGGGQSWDYGDYQTMTLHAQLLTVTSGGTETSVIANTATLSNFAGDAGFNLVVGSPVSLPSGGKIRLKIWGTSANTAVASFDYTYSGSTQLNASTIAFNCDAWAYFDDDDTLPYYGFGVGNPTPYRLGTARLMNVVLQ